MSTRWSPRLVMPPWSWITSMPSGWPTRWLTRHAGGPGRPSSVTEGAGTIRCTASASCCSPGQSSSPTKEECGCEPDWRLVVPPVKSPRPGRARRAATCRLHRSRHGGGPRRAGALLPLGRRRRSCRAVPACPHGQGVGGRDPRLPCHQRLLQRAHRGRQPAGQEGQARRTRLPQLRQLPAAAAAALRRQVADSPNRKAASRFSRLVA